MKKIALILIPLLLVAGCARTPRLVILHTNDTHSHLEPMRSGPLDSHGGAIERAAFVDSVRRAVGESRVLLLHAGDFSQGTSYFTEFGGEVEDGVLRAMRYDCVTLGNHEFDNGIEALGERLSGFECEVVCANLDLSPFELGKKVKPYAIIERGGLKVGIIGLEADLSSCVSKTVSSRIPQLDPVEVTLKYASILRSEGCDLVILLSHQGYEEDHRIVAASRGLDLVIGGHTHTFVEDFDYVRDLDGRKVPIITDGCWGLEMGEVRVY